MYQIHMIPGTYYVPDTYDTRYVLCTRYVCTTLAVVLLIVQLYRYLFIRAKRVSNCYIQRKKSVICACVRLILVLVGGRRTVYGQNTVYLCLSKYVPQVEAHVYDSMIPGTYYVPDTYVPHLPLYY